MGNTVKALATKQARNLPGRPQVTREAVTRAIAKGRKTYDDACEVYVKCT